MAVVVAVVAYCY